MNRSPGSRAMAGLARYVHAVANRLGPDVVAFSCDATGGLATAVMVLRSRVPTFEEWLLLLTWDEVDGWALRIGLDDNEDTAPIAFFGADILPEPTAVAGFLTDAVSGRFPGTLEPPDLRHPNDDDDLETHLARFQQPLP